jgi:hypothetical protein
MPSRWDKFSEPDDPDTREQRDEGPTQRGLQKRDPEAAHHGHLLANGSSQCIVPIQANDVTHRN